jgi:hypothetical protein
MILSLLIALPAYAFKGSLQSNTQFFPSDLKAPTQTLIPRISLELEETQKLTKSWKYSFKGYGESNLATEGQPEKYFADLSEAFVEWKKPSLKARLGWNTLNWGVLDLYSPMDVVNQRIYFDPFNSQKRGAPMLELQWNPKSWGISAIYIPFQGRSLLPSSDSRWYPRQVLMNLKSDQGQLLLPQKVEYNVASPVQLNNALENNFGFNVEKRWDEIDLHAIYFDGAAVSPSAQVVEQSTLIHFPPDAIYQGTGPITLHPLYYRTRTTGFGFTANTGSLIVRGESTYQSTLSPVSGQPFSSWTWQNGLGLEKNWEIGSGTLTQIIHYYRGQYPRSTDNLPTSSFRLFDDTLLLGGRISLSDDKFVYASAVYEFPQAGIFWTLGYQAKLKESLLWNISWRNISAQKAGLLKTYAHNSHASMDLTYLF